MHRGQRNRRIPPADLLIRGESVSTPRESAVSISTPLLPAVLADKGKAAPLRWSPRSASMRTRTFPPIFTSLAFWINSQTQRFGVVGDASTPARSLDISSWIFVAMKRLCAFCFRSREFLSM